MKKFFAEISMDDSVMAKFLECAKHRSKYGGKHDTVESFLCKWIEELHDGFIVNSTGFYFIDNLAYSILQELHMDKTFGEVYRFVWGKMGERLESDLVSWTAEYEDCEPKFQQEADECLSICRQRIQEWKELSK